MLLQQRTRICSSASHRALPVSTRAPGCVQPLPGSEHASIPCMLPPTLRTRLTRLAGGLRPGHHACTPPASQRSVFAERRPSDWHGAAQSYGKGLSFRRGPRLLRTAHCLYRHMLREHQGTVRAQRLSLFGGRGICLLLMHCRAQQRRGLARRRGCESAPLSLRATEVCDTKRVLHQSGPFCKDRRRVSSPSDRRHRSSWPLQCEALECSREFEPMWDS